MKHYTRPFRQILKHSVLGINQEFNRKCVPFNRKMLILLFPTLHTHLSLCPSVLQLIEF